MIRKYPRKHPGKLNRPPFKNLFPNKSVFFRAVHILKCECTTQRSPIAGLGIWTGYESKKIIIMVSSKIINKYENKSKSKHEHELL